MKRLSPIFFVIFLAINIIAGLVLSNYPLFNMVLNSAVICIALLFSLWINKEYLGSAFSTSIAFIIPSLTIIELVIGFLAPSQFEDNWGIIVILCLMAFEGFLIYSVIRRTKKSVKK